MPVTDILNPTTVLTNNAVVSSANALAVKVISGGGSGITIGTTTITGGTTTRLLYDLGGVVQETPALTYASASAILAGTIASFASLKAVGSAAAATLTFGDISAAAGVMGDGANLAVRGFSAGGGAIYFQSNDGTTYGRIESGGLIVGVPVAIASNTIAYGGVTFASTVTGSGSLVGATNPTLSSLVASGTLTYGGVTFASTVTGSGSLVGATGPSLSSLVATGTLTYGGVALASTVTGTGSMVLSASPTLSGTASFAATVHSGLATFSSAQTTVGTGTFQNAVAASASVVSTAILFSSTASFGIIFGALGSVAPTLATSQGTLLLNTTGSSVASRMFIRTSSSWSAVTTAA